MWDQDVSQGDIIIVDFNPSVGHEEKKKRPVLIISNDEYNRLTNGLVKVLAISSTVNDFPLHIPLPKGVGVHGKVLVQQEKIMDLMARPYHKAGSVSSKFLSDILEVVSETY